jgi:hypothetical protein
MGEQKREENKTKHRHGNENILRQSTQCTSWRQKLNTEHRLVVLVTTSGKRCEFSTSNSNVNSITILYNLLCPQGQGR